MLGRLIKAANASSEKNKLQRYIQPPGTGRSSIDTIESMFNMTSIFRKMYDWLMRTFW